MRFWGRKDNKAAKNRESELQKLKNRANEADEAPSSGLRLRDIVGGDYLWLLARNQIWLIVLIVVITTAYIAVRYQCQQDAIDISMLEKQLDDAKNTALSSTSNLTKQSRQSNIQKMMRLQGDTTILPSQHPAYIVEVPEPKK
ncbi:MAG: hypothetical protein K6G08_05585 [Prevotella sp.]|nr:hypothetical protein [Prevotella sp.]